LAPADQAGGFPRKFLTDGSGKGSLRDGFPREMQLYCGSRVMMDPERKRLEARRSAPFVRGRQPEPAMAHGIR
jgi:hypothetical protein